MRTVEDFEFPEHLMPVMRRARRLEWITLAYTAIAATSVHFVMSASQAAKAAFFEDLISLVPALAFLVCLSVRKLKPSRNFPYGRGGAVGIGYLTSALALAAMGLFLMFGGVMTFLHGERTTLGGMSLFGRTLWGGWPIIGVLIATAVGSITLGRLKMKLAPQLNDKILFADAKMMQADWTSALATCVGVMGVGLGLPWLDPLAGLLIGADIFKDGFDNTRTAVDDLIERRPKTIDGKRPEGVPEQLKGYALGLDWVEEAEVRLRDVGHVYFAEVFVRPRDGVPDLPRRVREAMTGARDLDWRLHDVTFVAVDDLDGADGGLRDG